MSGGKEIALFGTVERLELPPGETRVVEASAWEIRELSSKGFAIVATWVDAGVIRLRENGEDREHVGPVRHFLLHRETGSALEARAKELEEVQRKWLEDRAAKEKAEKKLAIVEKELAESGESAAKLAAEIPALRTKANRLEEDMGKVREAIGSVRLREILGGDQ